jgi:hypothetical protein
MSQNWIDACCDELWFVVLDSWKLANGRVPSGFSFDDILADAKARSAA